MKIKLMWPKCRFLNKQWTNEEMDSYWVECTIDEAKNKVFSYLSTSQIDESMKNREPKENDDVPIKIDSDHLYFLISKDLQSIESFPWYYPYSGQWNAYCPFVEIEEVDISDLKEILELDDVVIIEFKEVRE
ncbi:hypothetical protein [Dehalobacter sp. 14DCB1]|uniref:hypothetical protein n=1 Tax=Dehalobacter sp. 14DCB1 TaxID=2070227 RepID=UPI0010525D8C|nr:hypothetical protein [Dehalobacter sp. 14DCB1]TCX53588.1 hypothetical protein C1I36_02275 [Dehalobacter sp. 14DCB1]